MLAISLPVRHLFVGYYRPQFLLLAVSLKVVMLNILLGRQEVSRDVTGFARPVERLRWEPAESSSSRGTL